MKKILIGLVLIVAVIVIFLKIAHTGINTDVGSLDIESVRPETFLLHGYPVIVSKNSTKDNLILYILPSNLINNNTTIDPKLADTVNIPPTELPFYGKEEVSINFANLDKSITAKIVSREVVKENPYTWPQNPIEVYKIQLALPDNINDEIGNEISRNIFISFASFVISDTLGNNHITIPEKYLVSNDSGKFVCLIVKKKELPSMDYQHYIVVGKLTPVVISGSKLFERYNGLQSYVYVQSGIKLSDQIVNPALIQNCK